MVTVELEGYYADAAVTVGIPPVAPEATRYELHRVWEVVGTVKPNERHIYAKRVFHFDEDSWMASVIDMCCCSTPTRT